MGPLIRLGLVACTVLSSPIEAVAQDRLGGERHKEVQLQDLQNQRMTLLALVEAMPDRWLNDADHDGQRTFAQQIAHASVAFATVTNRLFSGGESGYTAPADAETRQYDKATLVETIDAAYRSVTEVMVGQSTEARRGAMPFSGSEVPAWRVWDELSEHAAWMGGQTVGNFRKHGLTPPSYRYLYPAGGE